MNAPSKTIVLVDDEKAYVDFLATVLHELLGVPVRTFARAQEALAEMPRLDVAVVVTDYWMPEMNGFEFIRTAAPLLPGVPFIVISGHAMHLDDGNLERLEALRTILPKPFSYRRLAEEILTHAPELRPGPANAAAPVS